MKKLALLLLLLPASAFAQQQVYCNASSQTPCNTTSDAGTGTSGEAAWLSFGKFNANFSTLQSEGLFSSVGSSTPGVLKVANGGTGTATPSLVAGTNVTISGTWPNQTISASGGGSSTTFQVNGTNLSSSTTVNFESSAATNGLTFTFTNPSAGNVQLGLSGWPALVSGDFLTNNGTALSWATALTNFTFTNGNGFTGTVTNPTTTPALSLAPSFTGLAYSNGSALGAATVGAGLAYSGGTLSATQAINAQVGTTYTIASTDGGKFITFSNSAAVAVTVPQATGSFGAGFAFTVQNLGTGNVTLTPTTSTINGQTTLKLPTGYGCSIVSDGTNYQIGSCAGNRDLPITLSAGSTITPNCSSNNNVVTITANITLAAPSGCTPYQGQKLFLDIIATSAYTYSASAYITGSTTGSFPSAHSSTGADHFEFIYEGTAATTGWALDAFQLGVP